MPNGKALASLRSPRGETEYYPAPGAMPPWMRYGVRCDGWSFIQIRRQSAPSWLVLRLIHENVHPLGRIARVLIENAPDVGQTQDRHPREHDQTAHDWPPPAAEEDPPARGDPSREPMRR